MRAALRLGVVLLVGLALAACGSTAAPSERPEFGYAGEVGPERWGDLAADWRTCATGTRQSPLDLAGPEEGAVADPVFRYVAGDGSVMDSGHTITIAVAPGSSLVLDGTTFALEQLHFHSPGEHGFDGVPAAVEWHFVHRSPGGSLAVVAVLLDDGRESAAWAPVVAAIGAAPPDGRPAQVRGLDPATLLPAGRGSVRYEGSLTTPPCTEGVRWIVLTERLQLSAEQLAAHRDRYVGNARPIQDRGGRPVRQDEPDR